MVKMTVGVDGMMCPMCEAHVASAVKARFPGRFEKVTASKGRKNCVIIASEELPEAEVRAAIDETGYRATSFSCEPWEKKKGLFGWLRG